MKKLLKSLAATALLAISGSVFALSTVAGGGASGPNPMAGADYNTPPPSSVIVSHGGYEWIWAAPCSEGAGSCGAPSHLFGFDTPTSDQWATWASRADLLAAFSGKCGSPYMSAFHNHCDVGDATNGHIFHAFANGICDPSYFNGCEAGTTESFLVRAVPEPQTYALMVAGLGLVGWVARRRRR